MQIQILCFHSDVGKKDKAGDFNEEKLLKKEMSFDFLKGGGKIEKIAKMSPVEYDMVCIA